MIENFNISDEELEKLSKEELITIIKEIKRHTKEQGEFLINISHDLRNPVNVILSLIQSSKYNRGNTIEETIKNYEEQGKCIKRNAFKIVKLINNLIDTEKLENNYYKLNKQNVEVVSVIENTVMSIECYARLKGIQLVFDTNIEECMAAIDVEVIDRVILNLLSNAIKFSPKNSEIDVCVFVGKESIDISIKDQGIGIKKEEQDLIFNRFTQGKAEETYRHRGSGIGLQLSRYLVTLHGGDIRLESEYGKGSNFIITLPITHIDNSESNLKFMKNNKVEQLELEFSDIYL